MKKKQIPNQNNIPIIDVFMKELREYLPLDGNEPLIGIAEQNKVLTRLHDNTAKSKFSIIIDGISGKIKHHAGIEKWLGYPGETFTTKKFFEITHPAHSLAHWMNGSSLWNLLNNNKELVTFYDLSWVFSIGLKHVNGSYKYCCCDAFFFQVSKQGKGMEFGYEFMVLGDYHNEEFIGVISDKNGLRPDIDKMLEEEKKKKFKEVGLFSKRELEILITYISSPNTKAQHIAQKFDIKINTVEKHNLHILDKAENFFHRRFETTKAFACHLERLALI